MNLGREFGRAMRLLAVAASLFVWAGNAEAQAWVAHHGLSIDQYQSNFNELTQQGFRLKCVSVYGDGISERYADMWVKEAGPAWQARHGLSPAVYKQTYDELLKQGFRLLWLSGHEANGEDRYEAIWEKSAGPARQARYGLTAVEYQQVFNDLTKQGYRLALVNGYSRGGGARYTGIFEKSTGVAWQARHGLNSVLYQKTFDGLTKQGYRLVHVSGYKNGGEAQYAAIFEKSNGPAWLARHGMSSPLYQTAFDDYVKQGFRLKVVSGYNVGGTDHYAAIFEKQQGVSQASNLLTNPVFEILHVGATAGQTMVHPGCNQAGFSPAGDWTTWMNSCFLDPSTHILTTELVPSTAPNGSHYMIHVVTDGGRNGIVQGGLWSAPKTNSSAWVFVNKGCVGIGTGAGGNTHADANTCDKGKWIHLQALNGVSPATEFIIYSVAVDGVPDSLKGADFFADNAEVVSFP